MKKGRKKREKEAERDGERQDNLSYPWESVIPNFRFLLNYFNRK